MATSAPVHWDTAVDVAGLVFDWLIESGQYAVLNCNVPDVPTEEVLGIRVGGLAQVGAAQTSVTEEQGKALKVTLGGADESTEVESDAALVQKGFAAVTALRPVVQDLSIDLAGLPEEIRPNLAPN